MNRKIEFDAKQAADVEQSYLTADIVETRRVVMDLLAARPGERILDIGCGPGFLQRDIADAVGPDGLAAGVDISEPMAALARRRCGGLANAEIRIGDAAALPWPDESFDGAVSTQVYEYVADLAAALAELRRVLKPGGRAIIMATDADSILIHSEDRDTTRRILAAWPAHNAHPYLPRTLARAMADAGFRVVARKVHVIFNHELGAHVFAGFMTRTMSYYAATQGAITKDEGKAWVAGLQSLSDAGRFFFSLNRDLFVAEKPAA